MDESDTDTRSNMQRCLDALGWEDEFGEQPMDPSEVKHTKAWEHYVCDAEMSVVCVCESAEAAELVSRALNRAIRAGYWTGQ